MKKKYSIEYSARIRGHSPEGRQSAYSDDTVACEEILEEMLDRGMLIHAIRRDGVDLPAAEFDRLVKIGASRLISERVRTSLGIKADEERARFGFAV